jgi:hypothetical protein
LISVFSDVKPKIDSSLVQGLKSDGVLSEICTGLIQLGYEVEHGKKAVDKIDRPVLFGDEGVPRVRYEVDAWLDDPGVVVEIEAGRGWMGNAFYRDLVRASLIVGANYLVIGMMDHYIYNSGGKKMASHDYESARDQLDAVFASGRMKLPFKGILLIGY